VWSATALFFAVARARNPTLVRLLLERGAKPTAAPGGGLVEHGASADVRDNDGVSPRLRASRKRDKRFFRALA
jgi:ankyrin repeat protein